MKELLERLARQDSREVLAYERTKLANERTLLAWLRSSIAFGVGGLAILKVEGVEQLYAIGLLLAGIGLAGILIGVGRFLRVHRRINRLMRSRLNQVSPAEEERTS